MALTSIYMEAFRDLQQLQRLPAISLLYIDYLGAFSSQIYSTAYCTADGSFVTDTRVNIIYYLHVTAYVIAQFQELTNAHSY